MKYLKQQLLYLSLCWASFNSDAQQLISLSRNLGSSENSLNWPSREMIPEFIGNGEVLSSSQGQISELNIKTKMNFKEKFKISAYLNPVINAIQLQVATYNKDMCCILSDLDGRIIMQQRIISTITIIKFTDLRPSIYFLKVSEKDKNMKLFRIIKK